ncbi:1-acyl-sn-glycerol-3-phosphate acyltransferase [Roseomonas sp. OT10]|uniref:lysophospholipid acyltransferase family protein n=1 Tax=Roseomonas cutis TaxID=2897332 RepID=UPI001E31B9A1|nr:lysophospholipid acyltransferase family protein [Roseomonas sp. OT10]UFN48241.1 1-acyl-sn-glycerol-3-phosphate acyltransferase [Roseomonas sp. OT10]
MRTPLFYLVLLAFAVLSLLWSLPAGLLYRVMPARAGQTLGQRAIMTGFRLYLWLMRVTGMLRVDLSALDTLRGAGALVIAPSHPSLLDAVLVISRLPRVVCIAKAGVWDNPLLGGGVRLAGYIRNDATRAMVRRAAEEVRAGRQLLIFPEGTRTRRPPLGPCSRSFAVMARMAGAPVQTVVIESDSPYLRPGWPLWRRPPLPLVYRVRLGRRFQPAGSAQALSDAIEAHLREELSRDGRAVPGGGPAPVPVAAAPVHAQPAA